MKKIRLRPCRELRFAFSCRPHCPGGQPGKERLLSALAMALKGGLYKGVFSFRTERKTAVHAEKGCPVYQPKGPLLRERSFWLGVAAISGSGGRTRCILLIVLYSRIKGRIIIVIIMCKKTSCGSGSGNDTRKMDRS
ncbi:hypothetical protein HMPREF1250_1511 [Megasphaera vaginalis (ex Srinivasan et al. 2021)]|uniref:Uncharacterized protein n=1 Tax=Megasphaera vaginalis (ex Srinivasan et al. 2021) TaxID=1111454 RepID=U7UAU5_9FIRM|nr:hypothetical protein HMPREF1250_1511 [Megasphaera vaginalis (ex Srinivasan et al. 2021)]